MSPRKSLSTRAWIEMSLLALIWGASFLSIRVALDEIGPLTVVAWRQMPISTGHTSILNAATAIIGVLACGLIVLDGRLWRFRLRTRRHRAPG